MPPFIVDTPNMQFDAADITKIKDALSLSGLGFLADGPDTSLDAQDIARLNTALTGVLALDSRNIQLTAADIAILKPHLITNIPYHASAVHFDSSSYLKNASLTSPDSSLLTVCGWIKTNIVPSSGAPTSPAEFDAESHSLSTLYLYGAGGSQGEMQVNLDNSDGQGGGFNTAVGAFPFDGVWTWIGLALDFSSGGPTPPVSQAMVYLGDTRQTFVAAAWNSGSSYVMNFLGRSVGIPGNPADQNILPQDMADVWLAPGVFIDFTVQANRRKFISATGKPVDLGANGELPTGTAPAIFCSGDAGTFGQPNLGTDGSLTLTGTLTDASTSPSD